MPKGDWFGLIHGKLNRDHINPDSLALALFAFGDGLGQCAEFALFGSGDARFRIRCSAGLADSCFDFNDHEVIGCLVKAKDVDFAYAQPKVAGENFASLFSHVFGCNIFASRPNGLGMSKAHQQIWIQFALSVAEHSVFQRFQAGA